MKIKITTSLALALSVCVVSIHANDLENKSSLESIDSNTQNDLNSNRSLSAQSQDTLNSKSASSSSTASKTYQLPMIGVQASKLNAYNLGGGGAK